MKVIGVTGGIGSGKSVVCRIFSKLGIPVYEADAAVHQLYEKYPELTEKIVKEIPGDFSDKNGKINRKKLGEIVFSDPVKLKVLNNLVHPVVKSDFKNWLKENNGSPYAIKEAAILFESGTNSDCEKVISVISPMDLRIYRVRERDRKPRNEVELIINRQMNDEERISRSDFVIYNDEKQLLIPQVLKIPSALLE
jgi:dephospho-CoA kinase